MGKNFKDGCINNTEPLFKCLMLTTSLFIFIYLVQFVSLFSNHAILFMLRVRKDWIQNKTSLFYIN